GEGSLFGEIALLIGTSIWPASGNAPLLGTFRKSSPHGQRIRRTFTEGRRDEGGRMKEKDSFSSLLLHPSSLFFAWSCYPGIVTFSVELGSVLYFFAGEVPLSAAVDPWTTLPQGWQETLIAQLEPGETLLGWFEADLDQRLRYARQLL